MRKEAFTLIELLVIIGILSLLIGIVISETRSGSDEKTTEYRISCKIIDDSMNILYSGDDVEKIKTFIQ